MSTLSTQKIQAVVKKDASWVNRRAQAVRRGPLRRDGREHRVLLGVFARADARDGDRRRRLGVRRRSRARTTLPSGQRPDRRPGGGGRAKHRRERASQRRDGGIAAIISFVLLAVGASATFSSLNTALNLVWP